MRLHPAVSYPLERVVPEEGAEMCDHYLPPGTIVGMHAWVIHRDQKIFGRDAEAFRPERWLSEDMPTLKSMDQNLLTVWTYWSRSYPVESLLMQTIPVRSWKQDMSG